MEASPLNFWLGKCVSTCSRAGRVPEGWPHLVFDLWPEEENT